MEKDREYYKKLYEQQMAAKTEDDFRQIPQELSTPEDIAMFDPALYLKKAFKIEVEEFKGRFSDFCFVVFQKKHLKLLEKKLGAKPLAQPLSSVGLFLYEKAGRRFFMGVLPQGASMSVIFMEMWIALGIQRVFLAGTAGAIQDEARVGDIYLCEQAVCDEGTSLHYQPKAMFSHCHFSFTELIEKSLCQKNIRFTRGLVWSTDGFFRETIKKYRFWKKKKTLAVDMELSALFSLCLFRKIKIAAVLVASDLLLESGWQFGMNEREMLHSFELLGDWFSGNLEIFGEQEKL